MGALEGWRVEREPVGDEEVGPGILVVGVGAGACLGVDGLLAVEG